MYVDWNVEKLILYMWGGDKGNISPKVENEGAEFDLSSPL